MLILGGFQKITFPKKFKMGLGLELQSDHLKLSLLLEKRIKIRINAITLTVGNIRKTVNSQKSFFSLIGQRGEN